MKHNKIGIEIGNLIALSSAENVDDFYENDPVELRSHIITGSQSLESTLSDEGKKRFQNIVRAGQEDTLASTEKVGMVYSLGPLTSP
jgi:hypothetical protein